MADPIAVIPKNSREEIRIGFNHFRGFELLDIRVHVDPREGDGDRVPTKAGVSIRVEQLPELIAALDRAMAAAVSRGLLEERRAVH